jgi:hypothetical protein
MPEFLNESSWSDAGSGGDPWESSRAAPLQEQRASRPSARAQRRPAAALASDVSELLESMARKRVPRLDAVRKRLHEGRAGLPLGEVERALQALHAATADVDFLAGRSGGERAGEFLRQGGALTEALRRLGPLLADFLQRESVGSPVTRMVWIDLVLESGSLRKRVRQAAQWLAEMDQDLLYRRRGANTAVTVHAIDELARRGVAMHERLQAVHRLCTQARAVHTFSERMAAERTALWGTLQDRVLPACRRLDEALHPLLHAASYRALVPTELIGAIEACHELQVGLTQGTAAIVRLEGGQQELSSQLALMEDKARRLTP